jgi:hypothetical protein
VPFRQYRRSKPAKHRVNFCVSADASTYHTHNKYMSTGEKQGKPREKVKVNSDPGSYVCALRGWERVTKENFPTSSEMAQQFLRQNASLRGL